MSNNSRPILPGVAAAARRPGALVLAPAWMLTLTPLLLGLCAWLVRWLDLGTTNTVTASGTVLSAVLLLIGWELKLRRDSYQQVVNAVAELVVAWERMKLASCISRAVESNLQWALHADNRELVGDERMKSVRRIGAELRQVAPTRRPITVSALFKLQRRRYRTVKKSNTDLRKVFASRENFRGQVPLEPPLVDAPALERLTEATGQWEAALALARASMTRWPVLEQLVVQCNTLVRQWWVYAQNNPYYRDPTADAEERLRWFEEAKEFMDAFREGIATRTIGQSTWRVLLLRVAVGRRGLATLDRQNGLVH